MKTMQRRVIADENIPLVEEAMGALGTIQTLPGRSITAADVQEAEALLVRSVTPVGPALLDESDVQFVGSATIGTDHIDGAYLRERGIEPIETDLGEYIVQLRHEPPSHIIAPAVHLNRDQWEADFRAHHLQLPPERAAREATAALAASGTVTVNSMSCSTNSGTSTDTSCAGAAPTIRKQTNHESSVRIEI